MKIDRGDNFCQGWSNYSFSYTMFIMYASSVLGKISDLIEESWEKGYVRHINTQSRRYEMWWL